MKKLLGAALTAAAVALATAPAASADGVWDSFEVNYADSYGAAAVCSFLDEGPTVDRVVGMVIAISNDSGFDYDSAVDVMNYSVAEYCPRHWSLLTAIGEAARAANQPQLQYAV